jgi:2-polyprenyl-3-methyl-5-hydroxy-6-metoxy-1,4-benzoquinol methylase
MKFLELFRPHGKLNYRDSGLYARTESGAAPFEVVLRYSTQKQILAKELATRFSSLDGPNDLAILDIGSSKGSLIAMLAGQLSKEGFGKQIQFSLLEPDASSVQNLQLYAEAIRDGSGGKFSSDIIQRGWEEFKPGKYDAIICSHVIYHFDPRRYQELFLKMVRALKPDGRLFISAREGEGNDIFQFIQKYKIRATGESFNQITITDAVPALESIVNADPSLRMVQTQLHATILLPFASKPADAKTMVAFFLQRPSWADLPAAIHRGVLHDYKGKDSSIV